MNQTAKGAAEHEGDEMFDMQALMQDMTGMPDAKLEQMSRDESLRQVERDVASAILCAREIDFRVKKGVEERERRRQEARETIDALPETKQLPAATGQRRGYEGLSKNEAAATMFADVLVSRCGLPAKARRTQKIQGRDVVDGWVVNVRDPEAEVGYVAAWWGRGHFTAYVEIAGHIDRTDEVAALFSTFQRILGDESQA